MSIAENAMVMNLSIGLWAGYRLDKQASQEITADKGADADAARVNKHLVPKDALKAVVSAATAVRTHFYANTLPWKDNGDRLLTRLMYTRFIEDHESLVATFNAAVEQFITKDYVNAVELAGFRMGALFDPDDYPHPDALRRKFYIHLDIDAVTTAGDFRVQMDEAEIDGIRRDMTRALEQRIGSAMRDVWERLAKVVGHMAEKLGNQDAVFRNSTITNLEELVDLLPGLNVLNDPDLDMMRRDIKAKLCGHDVADLRKDPAHRAQIASEAKQIMETMAGFMNAFSKLEEGEVQ